MNALLLTAVCGVIMMFSSFLLTNKAAIRAVAVFGLILALVANVLEMRGTVFFRIDTRGMLDFDRFALLFNTIIFACTLAYFLLSAKDMEKVGANYSEYFALIFFVLCGVTLVSSFRSLLILFLGIEIRTLLESAARR
jgi:NADH-quinone oxidoreductase subunit N